MTKFEACAACVGDVADDCRRYREELETGYDMLALSRVSPELASAGAEGMRRFTVCALERAGCVQSALAALNLAPPDF